jgi:hypothetical protein
LTFFEQCITLCPDFRVVNKYILIAIVGNGKAVSLLIAESFHYTLFVADNQGKLQLITVFSVITNIKAPAVRRERKKARYRRSDLFK